MGIECQQETMPDDGIKETSLPCLRREPYSCTGSGVARSFSEVFKKTTWKNRSSGPVQYIYCVGFLGLLASESKSILGM